MPKKESGSGAKVELYRYTPQKPVFMDWTDPPQDFGTSADGSGGTGLSQAAIINELCIPVVAQYNGSGGAKVFVTRGVKDRVSDLKIDAAAAGGFPGGTRVYGEYEHDPKEDNSPLLVKGRLKEADFRLDAGDILDVDNSDSQYNRSFIKIYDYETYTVRDKQEESGKKRIKLSEFDGGIYGSNLPDRVKKHAAETLHKIRKREAEIRKKANSFFSGKDGEICDIGETKEHAAFSGETGKEKLGKKQDVIDDIILIRMRFVSGEQLFKAGFGMPCRNGGEPRDEGIRHSTYSEIFPGGRNVHYEDVFGLGKYDDYPPAKFLASRVDYRMKHDQGIEPGDDIGESQDWDETFAQFGRWIARHKVGLQYRMEEHWYTSRFTDFLNNRTVHTGCEYNRLAENFDKYNENDKKSYITSEQIDDANYDVGSGMFGTKNIFLGRSNSDAKPDVRKYDAYPCSIFSGKCCDANFLEARYWMKAHAIDHNAYPAAGEEVTGKQILSYIRSCGGSLDESAETVLSKTTQKFDGFPVEWAYEIPYYVEAGFGGDSDRAFRSAYVGRTPWRFTDEGKPERKCWVRVVYHWMKAHEKGDADHPDAGDITKKSKYRSGKYDDGSMLPAHVWYKTLLTKYTDNFPDLWDGIFQYETDDLDPAGNGFLNDDDGDDFNLDN